MKKPIQLTNRDNQATWRTKHADGTFTRVKMADLDDASLQKFLAIAQTRKVKSFLAFINDAEREAQLKKVAKDRNMVTQDLDYGKPTYFNNKFGEYKEVMITAYSSTLRKLKALASEAPVIIVDQNKVNQLHEELEHERTNIVS